MTPDARALRRRRAQTIERADEVDPRVYVECGAEMPVIAFVIDHQAADQILKTPPTRPAVAPVGDGGDDHPRRHSMERMEWQ